MSTRALFSNGATLLAAFSVATIASAEAQTAPATVVVADNATHTTVDYGTGGDITVRDGLLQGANLFHSFQNFDVGTDARVIYSAIGQPSPGEVQNLISLVTGGDVSDIYGEIDTTAFSAASYFLISPAGVVVGPGAVLNVPGSVHLSTADRVRFADNSELVVTTLNGSTFSASAPQAFGFVSSASLEVLDGVSLTVSAADTRNRAFTLSSGNITIGDNVAIASNLDFAAIAAGDGYSVPVHPTEIGNEMFGGQLNVGAAAFDFSEARAYFGGEDITFRGASIRSIATDPRNSLRIEASGEVSIVDSDIQTFGRLATAGDIAVTGETIRVVRSNVESNGADGGSGGDVALRAGGDIFLSEGSVLASDAMPPGSVDPGVVLLAANGLVSLASGSEVLARSGSETPQPNPLDPGAGLIRIVAGDLEMSGGSRLVATSLGARNAGAIDVHVDGTITLTGASRITSGTLGYGISSAGEISIEFGDLMELDGGSVIASVAKGPDTFNAGAIQITSEDGLLSLSGGSQILATVASFRPQRRLMRPGAGAIFVDVGDLSLTDVDTKISAETFGARNAGNIWINADRNISLDNGAAISTTATVSSIGGNAGSITVLAGGGLTIENGASIHSNSAPSGNAAGRGGRIQIGNSDRPLSYLHLLNGGSIVSRSRNANEAGSITIHASDVLVAGSSPILSRIATKNNGIGPGGNVQLFADDIALLDGGSITTDSVRGRAGNIDLHIGDGGLLILTGGDTRSSITTSARDAGGGGVINIENPLAIISNGAQILARGPAGGANVHISSAYWLQSADQQNDLFVDGALVLDTSSQDVSRGGEAPDLPFIDASQVLRGRCTSERTLSERSQLGAQRLGIYQNSAPPVALLSSTETSTCPTTDW